MFGDWKIPSFWLFTVEHVRDNFASENAVLQITSSDIIMCYIFLHTFSSQSQMLRNYPHHTFVAMTQG